MFFYTTSRKFVFDTKLVPLAEKPEWVELAAKWIEDKWGYIRKLGVEKRSDVIQGAIDRYYILTYSGVPVGMFSLLDYSLPNSRELSTFYIEESFRGIGIGGKLVESAKKIAADLGVTMIVLDTLNPRLNQFYIKHGATVVGEATILGHPTSWLGMQFKAGSWS